MKRTQKIQHWLGWAAMKTRYRDKRHTPKWINRKRFRKEQRRRELALQRKHDEAPYKLHVAPRNFSLIANTNEVLGYIQEAEDLFLEGKNVTFDISEVESLTSDALTLLVASINNPGFHRGAHYRGNAPKKPELNKLFNECGFLEHVSHLGDINTGEKNLLHRERAQNVSPKIAERACIAGLQHVFKNSDQFEPLYDILIECMSNTNNHADLNDQGKIRWWLEVYSDPNEILSAYSFLDLGVGIFESAVVQGKISQFLKRNKLYRNINLVDDLLNGKLQSRIDKDNDIRGKGFPQIIKLAESQYFKSFYIISNDVKIDLKTRSSMQLNSNLKGTFLYWELTN